jgi:hypothetical protein
VLHQFFKALGINPNVPSKATGYHLGPVYQSRSKEVGYNKQTECLTLKKINRKSNGYGLFDVSVLAGVHPEGENGEMNKSCSLFLKSCMWNKIGGFINEFKGSGGGFGTLDLFYHLMQEIKGEINVLGGEGCFHQIHGEISTSINPPTIDWQN